MVQVCGALEEAHRAGIVHRDLKPENVFLTNQAGTADFPKVLDFGLAKMSEKQMGRGSLMLTQQGMVFGTPEFMSPEQTLGETVDARSDIYSLALIFFELLTGKLPFDAKTPLDIMKAHVKDPPIPLSERIPGKVFSPELDAVIRKALAKKPGDRYATAIDFADALKSCLSGGMLNTAARRAMPSKPSPSNKPASVRPTGADAGVVQTDDDPPQIPVSRAPTLILGLALGIGVAVAGYLLLSMLGK
jgi:serine/threonine-protein kinase